MTYLVSIQAAREQFEAEALLTLLEEPVISYETILELISTITEFDVELAGYFFTKKIRAGIDPQRLLNIMRHFKTHEKIFLPFNIKLNTVIIWQFINGEHPEYLYDLLERDRSVSKSLLLELGVYLAEGVTSNEAESYIQNIAKNTTINLCELYYIVLKSASNVARRLMILDHVEDITLYDLLVKLYSGSMTIDERKLVVAIIHIVDNRQSTLYNIIQSRLHDDYGICLAIRNSITSVDIISNYVFRRCLFEKAQYIPKTIKHLFESAIYTDKLSFLIDLAEIYDKREIFRALLIKVDENNKNLFYLNTFIKAHKESKEIRNLIPFI